MSTESQTSQASDTETADSQTSPGQFLTIERERQGLSQKQVADKLHITVHYVNAIEHDAFEKLPGTIFAKGYMKRYAEFLQIDESEVLDKYESLQQAQQEHEKEVARITRRKHQARNLNMALISVVLFAGIFAGLWFWNNGAQPADTAVTPVNGENDRAIVNPEETQRLPETQSNDVPVAEIEPANSQAANISSVSMNEVIEPETAQTVVSPIAADVTTASTTESAEDSESDQSNSERIITISNEGDDVLRVSFSDESFIQVTDGNDNRLYRGVLQSGDVLEITDSAPFDILLENAPPTRLTLNGTEIDVSDSIRIDNSARLTVGL